MDPRLGFADMVSHAQRLETLGYDGIHVPETIHDSLASALLIASNTPRVVVRTAVTLAFVRSPSLTAYSAWDLAKVSAGRFELGLGTQIRQNIADRYGMPWGDPVATMRDYIGALNALYASFRDGTEVSFESEHYRLTRLQPFFNPGPDDTVVAPPTYLGGVNAGICRLAGELTDGFVTHPTNSDPRYLTTVCLPNLRAGAEAAGRDLSAGGFELVVGTQVITGDSTGELEVERERVRRLLAFLYSTPAYARTLELYGWEHLGPALRQLTRAGQWQELHRTMTDEVLDVLAPSATFDELAPLLVDRLGDLAQGVLLSPPVDRSHDERFGEVIAALQAAGSRSNAMRS